MMASAYEDVPGWRCRDVWPLKEDTIINHYTFHGGTSGCGPTERIQPRRHYSEHSVLGRPMTFPSYITLATTT